jgi:CheY-like chemotaxis protein
MDIQMPEMDGIEATKVIREELKLSTPIIALTANAFKTEIEKCKKAGMNDYVVKPFEESVLLQTIVKHTISKNGIPSLDNEVIPNQPLYNLNVLRNSSRGSDGFVLKMVGVFVEQIIATIEKIDAAFESNNFSEISRLIHKIRPSVDNMGILSIQSEMKTLEIIAKETQNKGQITAIYKLVKETLQLVISQLQKDELNA